MSPTVQRKSTWTIRLRLLASFFVIFLTLAGYGLYISNATQRIHQDLVVTQQRNAQYRLLWTMKYYSRHMTGKARGVIFTTDAAVREKLQREYEVAQVQYEEVVDQLVLGAVSQQEMGQLETLNRAGRQLRNDEAAMFAAVSGGNPATAHSQARDAYVTHEAIFVDLADRVLEEEGSSIATSVNVLRERSLSLDLISFVMLAVMLSLILAIFLMIHRNVIQPIHALSAIAARFAAGDFAARAALHSHDEIGTLGTTFNEMGERLGERAKEVTLAKENLETEVKRRTTELEAKLQEVERFNKFAIGRELKMIELKKALKRAQGGRHGE